MTGTDRPTVLVVEDELELKETFGRWLKPMYEVITVTTADAALRAMNDAVDVVLLDRRLPDRSGSEVLHEIREKGYDCRVAMITAVDPDVDIFDMEFDDYVVKPVLKDELLDIVSGLLSLAEYNDRIKKSFRLASKLAVLEAEKSMQDLQKNPEYQAKREELAALNEDIDDLLAEFENGSFAVAYRDLERFY